MYSSKLSISKRFSMSVTWNILYILPCSVNLRFTTLLKNQVEWIFRALLSCRHLYASCWFSWDILSLTKSLPENFRLLSSWDLLPRFLRLYITEFFCLQHLNLTITLSVFFIQLQACKWFGTILLQLMTTPCKCFLLKHLQWRQQAQGLTLLSLFYCIGNFSQHYTPVVLFLSVNRDFYTAATLK